MISILSSIPWQKALELVNVILVSGIVILSFAFLLYLLVYSSRKALSRSFAALLGCVLIAYFVDLALFGVAELGAAVPWLRLQWLGIAFIPAAYLGFSNDLLVTTGDRSRGRSMLVLASYGLSTLLFAGALATDLIVHGGDLMARAPHMRPGPLFPGYVAFFVVAVGMGTANVLRARRRCLTSTSRRRMGYLTMAFAAPAAGVFPYLLLAGWPDVLPGLVLWFLLVLGNIGVGTMLVLLAYSVAFFGALTPDRVVKHRLVRFLMRGPLLATLVVVVILGASQAEGWLGLPSLRLTLIGVVAVILLIQLAIEIAKPLIDRALYRQDQPEIAWIQDLSNRLLTTTDLRQFLENVLTALCDLLRVRTAFVAVFDDGTPHLEVVCGQLEPHAVPVLPPDGWKGPAGNGAEGGGLERRGDLFVWDGFWLVPLHDQSPEGELIGMVGMAARTPEPDLTAEEKSGMESLLSQVVVALDDRRLQQGIFRTLERIIPEIEDIQRRRGVVRYIGDEALRELADVENAAFREWVRDALRHYWGGPKLAESPLLGLSIVERAASESGVPGVQGLRSVLRQAIEALRPGGERQMTTPEWVLYNILELKFLQGRRVREVARRLAMSEADLYRKQRVAIEAVAELVAEMEREALKHRRSDPDSVDTDTAAAYNRPVDSFPGAMDRARTR